MEKQALDHARAHLMQSSEEFRTLAEKHAEYKRLIENIEAKGHLSAEDEVEEHRLKKLKLHLKDQMHEMVAHYRAQTQSEVA